MRNRSPIAWFGGKSKIAPWIISLFPHHRHFVVVCAGGLHVLFAKKPIDLETVNDLDGRLVNFWMMCRDRADELIDLIYFTPYSRALYEQWKKEDDPEDPLERAARWFYMNAAAINSFYTSGWSYLKSRGTVWVPPPLRFRRRAERILAARDRLANVQIDCQDFRVMFDRFSHDPANLLYIDPPYFDRQWYTHNFTDQDHLDLAELARQSEAKIAISYEAHPMVDQLYKGWHMERLQQVRHSKGAKPRGKKPRVLELVITNYEVKP